MYLKDLKVMPHTTPKSESQFVISESGKTQAYLETLDTTTGA